MTLRYIGLLAMCVAIAFLSIPRMSNLVVTKTGRDLDIAIVGRGNFCLVDTKSAELRYTRSGNLQIDQHGQLAAIVDGVEWPLDPPIQMPSDWERVSFLTDGRVQALQGGSWSDVGELQLAVFTSSSAFDNPLAANVYPDSIAPPTHHAPGDVAGVIQQGWVEQTPSVLPALATRILLAILAAGFVWRCTAPTIAAH